MRRIGIMGPMLAMVLAGCSTTSTPSVPAKSSAVPELPQVAFSVTSRAEVAAPIAQSPQPQTPAVSSIMETPDAVNHALVVTNAPPVTNHFPIAWQSGYGISNRIAWVQTATNVEGPYTNFYPFPMDGQGRFLNIVSTLPHVFTRLKYNSGDLVK